jgi:hypothetical protein
MRPAALRRCGAAALWRCGVFVAVAPALRHHSHVTNPPTLWRPQFLDALRLLDLVYLERRIREESFGDYGVDDIKS